MMRYQWPRDGSGLIENEMTTADLIQLFEQWMQDARDQGEIEPTSMALATAGEDGQPHVRIVLLKGLDERGFVFYTNLGSHKADQLSENNRAGLCFYFKTLERQVRVEGHVVQVSDEEADAYFASRHRDSRVGAWASRQSRMLSSRNELEACVNEATERFANEEVPRPPFWSGFRLEPTMIEFWQGKAHRLHDRIRYTHQSGRWHSQRLFP